MNGTPSTLVEKKHCSKPECARPSRTRGMCVNHYQAWLWSERRLAQSRKHPPRGSITAQERFRRYFRPGADSQCWEWQGARRQSGHGMFGINGSHVVASRFALEQAVGPAPDGALACHRCDNPPCVNPKHLYWGTRQDNADDAVSRGRIPLGEDKAQSVLTEQQVIEIRERYAAGEPQKSIAQSYPVTVPTIRSIALGDKWKHVGGPISQPRRKSKHV